MFNVCHKCGLYRADKIVDPSGPYAICPECGHRHTFRQLPLLMVSGASGAGKSSVCNALLGKLDHVVLLDSNILWRAEFDKPQESYREFFETWLRMAKNISQSGRPVVLFGAGLGVPGNIEPCVGRRYFSQVPYLALVCDDNELAQRLKARPDWHSSGDPAYLEGHIHFNRSFWEADGLHPPLSRIDTTNVPLELTLQQVQSWILERSTIVS